MKEEKKVNKGILDLVVKLAGGVWGLAYFALAVVVIFWLSYLLGHPILDGVIKTDRQVLVGNDSAFALSLVYWFDRFFPKVPVWYPLQGMGVSLLYSYPMGTTFLVIVLRRILSVSAIEVFRVLSFLTFPLTAIGIYLLSWVRLKRQTIGLIAAAFFLLSQASWLFQALHGIFAQSFSMIFVAPVLILFDLFIEQVIKGEGEKIKGRIYLVLTSILMGMIFLIHVVAGIMVVIMLMMWAGLRLWFIQGGKKGVVAMIRRGARGVLLAMVVMILGVGVGAFWLVPFSRYTALANRKGLNTRSVSAIQEESLRLPSLLGLSMLGEGIYRYDFFFFATPVLVFFGIGVVGGLIGRRKKLISMVIVSVVFLGLTMVPIYVPFVAKWFQFFFSAVYFRGLIPVLIILPLVAAWGVWSIPAGVLLGPISLIEKKLKSKGKGIVRGAVWLVKVGLTGVVSGLALVIAYLGVKNLAYQPPPNPDFRLNYKYQFQPYGPSLSNKFNELLEDPTKFMSFKPQVEINKEGMQGKTILNEALDEWFEIDDKTILDVSPFAAGGAIMQGVGLASDTRFTNLYHYYASLIHGMWGYQAGVFFGKEPLYKSSRLMSDLTDWFGLKYVVVVDGFDPIEEKYKPLGWKPMVEFNEYSYSVKEDINQGPWGIEVWENPEPEGLYSLSNRPVILVISDSKEGGYDHVFRSSNLGALTYKNAWLVEGSERIDDYSLAELNKFDGVILHGYSYRNKGSAWARLRKYVEEGGKLFVDTGWQYIAKDWGSGNRQDSMVSLPDPMPVEYTRWTDIGTSWEGIEVDKGQIKEMRFPEFDDLIWDGTAWGMAVANKSDLREGTKPVLWKGDKVFMASREFGEGKVVWSGMNIMAHVTGDFNEAEADFLAQVLKPLFSGSVKEKVIEPDYNRVSPDEVEFTFNSQIQGPVWLLFRESVSPYWQASIKSNQEKRKLAIWRGGPGFVLIRLDDIAVGDKLKLEAKLSVVDDVVAKLVSVITGLGLVLYLIIGGKIDFKKLKVWEKATVKLKKSVGKALQEEEDY